MGRPAGPDVGESEAFTPIDRIAQCRLLESYSYDTLVRMFGVAAAPGDDLIPPSPAVPLPASGDRDVFCRATTHTVFQHESRRHAMRATRLCESGYFDL